MIEESIILNEIIKWSIILLAVGFTGLTLLLQWYLLLKLWNFRCFLSRWIENKTLDIDRYKDEAMTLEDALSLKEGDEVRIFSHHWNRSDWKFDYYGKTKVALITNQYIEFETSGKDGTPIIQILMYKLSKNNKAEGKAFKNDERSLLAVLH